MQCANCSGQYVTVKGYLELNDKILGSFKVQNVEYEECEGCGKKLYPPITLRAIEKAENRRKEDLLSNKPLGEFILATEVAEILGCSRQAVHKNKKIRRGFIHFIRRHDVYYYLRKSAELYKETGDGRLQLAKPKPTATNVVDFSKFLELKQKEQNTECQFDAGTDILCESDSKTKKRNFLEDSMEG